MTLWLQLLVVVATTTAWTVPHTTTLAAVAYRGLEIRREMATPTLGAFFVVCCLLELIVSLIQHSFL